MLVLIMLRELLGELARLHFPAVRARKAPKMISRFGC